MINVECPACQASYDLNENRVPEKGMNMRCPKCSAKFHVAKDGTVGGSEGAENPAAASPAPTDRAESAAKLPGMATQTVAFAARTPAERTLGGIPADTGSPKPLSSKPPAHLHSNADRTLSGLPFTTGPSSTKNVPVGAGLFSDPQPQTAAKAPKGAMAPSRPPGQPSIIAPGAATVTEPPPRDPAKGGGLSRAVSSAGAFGSRPPGATAAAQRAGRLSSLPPPSRGRSLPLTPTAQSATVAPAGDTALAREDPQLELAPDAQPQAIPAEPGPGDPIHIHPPPRVTNTVFGLGGPAAVVTAFKPATVPAQEAGEPHASAQGAASESQTAATQPTPGAKAPERAKVPSATPPFPFGTPASIARSKASLGAFGAVPAPKPRSKPLGADLPTFGDDPGASAGLAPTGGPGRDEPRIPEPPLMSAGDEVDLPAPKPAASPTAHGLLDLPTPKAAATPKAGAARAAAFGAVDLPATKARTAAASAAFGGVDLPAAKAGVPKAPPPSLGEADLPAPKINPPKIRSPQLSAPGTPAGFGALDLPAPKVISSTPAATSADSGELDLPAPKISGPTATSAAFGELDLPAPKAGPSAGPAPATGLDVDVDLPKPKSALGGAAPALDFGDIDLPAKSPHPVPAEAQLAGGLDLPSAKHAHPTRDRGSDNPLTDTLDLPGISAGKGEAQPSIPLQADLPRRSGAPHQPAPASPSALDDLPGVLRPGLPGLQRNSAMELPRPQLTADLPPPADAVDLPRASGGLSDLPAPMGLADLPQVQGGSDLPMSASEFGMLDLPLPIAAPFSESEAPPPAGAAMADLSLPTPLATAELLGNRSRTALGLGEQAPDLQETLDSDLPPSLLGDDEADFSELTLEGDPPPLPLEAQPSVLPEPLGRFEKGTTSGAPLGPTADDPAYGDVDLGDDAEALLGDEEMEFGIDDENLDTRNFSLPPEMLRRRRAEEQAAEPKRGARAAVVLGGVFGVLALLALIGVGLGMFTHHGYFGVYFLEQYSAQAGTPAFAREAIERAESVMANDSYDGTRTGLRLLGDARRQAGLNRTLLARSLMHEAFARLRFGEGATATSHGAAILRRLDERGGQAPGIALARAADLARRGEWQQASDLLATARSSAPGKDPYPDLLAGEIALAQGEARAAQKAFAAAMEKAQSARAQWGLARAAELAGDEAAMSRAIAGTLEKNPNHAEARIAAAKAAFQRGEVDAAIAGLRVAIGQAKLQDRYLQVAPTARAAGLSALGYIQEVRGQLHLARRAYDAALKVDANQVEALIGAGRVMLRERRFGDALARFETAFNATKQGEDPPMLSGRSAGVEADLGRARAMLALDRAPDAKHVMEALRQKHPEDAELADVAGQVEEALTNEARAEELYRRAIELAPSSFGGYLSLSQLLGRKGRADRASEVLNEATNHVPETAEMRRMLGQAELSRNHLDAALHEFSRALELDPSDLWALFGRGQAMRRDGRLAEAGSAFDAVAERDPLFPGLALERGLLLEAQGNFAGAIAGYEAALAQTPGDLQLVLRLGAAQVEENHLDAAEATLRKVVLEMPNSAEAEYFIGRIAFGRGRTPDALTHFDRALSLDGTQGEIHLYAGRAAFEMGNLGRALEEVEAALEREPSLGDGYWVRGMVRLRMGAVRDALRDLSRGIALNPSRIEVHAAMAECFEQMGDLPKAGAAWHAALRADPGRGIWWYRLAQLQLDRGKRAEAGDSIEKALARATTDQAGRPAAWVADAERIAGDIAKGQGQRDVAIGHYRRYLEAAQDGHVDRTTVENLLRRWGVAVAGDEPPL